MKSCCSIDRSVGVTSRLRAGMSGIRIPLAARDFFFSKTSSVVLRIKRPTRESNLSSLSSTEVRNEWSYISTPPISLHGVERKNFTLLNITKF